MSSPSHTLIFLPGLHLLIPLFHTHSTAPLCTPNQAPSHQRLRLGAAVVVGCGRHRRANRCGLPRVLRLTAARTAATAPHGSTTHPVARSVYRGSMGCSKHRGASRYGMPSVLRLADCARFLRSLGRDRWGVSFRFSVMGSYIRNGQPALHPHMSWQFWHWLDLGDGNIAWLILSACFFHSNWSTSGTPMDDENKRSHCP